MADFKTRTPGIDPQAFANVLQRKAQMEQEQINTEIERKQGRTKRLLDAVVAGQTIASNMMTIAEKRTKMAQEAREQEAQTRIADLVSRPPAIPTEEPSLDPKINQQRMAALAQERTRELSKNLAMSSSAPDLNKALIAKEFPTKERGLISGKDIQQFWLVSPDGQQRKSVRYDEVADTMTDLMTGQELDRSSLGDWQMVRATPTVKEDAEGNFLVIEPTTGTASSRVGSGAVAVPKEKYDTVKSLNDPLVGKNDRKEIIDQTKTIENDESVKNAKKLAPQLHNVIRYLDTNNKIAMDRLGGLTQKLVALDSGNLAAWEQRDPNARAIIDRIHQFYTMNTRGELTTANKEELKKLLNLASENLSENVSESAGVTLNRLQASYPQMNRKYLEELAGLNTFYGYMNRISKTDPRDKPAAGINVDQSALDAELQRRGLK